jgi:hypothetical protein
VELPSGRKLDLEALKTEKQRFGLQQLQNLSENEERVPHPDALNINAAAPGRSVPGVSGSESDVEPDSVFGVAEGAFPRKDVCNPICPPGGDDAQDIFGTFAQMVADVSAMGGGRLRRVKFCDIYWGSVFPSNPSSVTGFQSGIKVPPPSEILERLQADGYAVLAYLGDFLDTCLLDGVKVSLTPFNSGGGSPLSVAISAGGTTSGPNPNTTWAEILKGLPPHHKGVRTPSEHGWDRWYWDLPSSGTSDERAYQRYALNVWPTRESETVPAYSAYARECARRKGLAVAAFCTGVAEFLAAYDRALRTWSAGEYDIYDIVEFIELGNELDGLFVIPANVASQVREPITEQDLLALDSEREAGRYMALIAGPFRRHLPNMRFRAAEILSSGPVDPEWRDDGTCTWTDLFRHRCEWIRESVRTGIDEEVQLWSALQRAQLRGADSVPGLTESEYAEWLATCDSAGWAWPPNPLRHGLLSLAATDLVHELGFHWYHMHDWTTAQGIFLSEPWRYADARRLGEAVDTFNADVLQELEAAGFDVGVSVGEIAFPATWPLGLVASDVQAPYYQHASELLQAAMLVRMLLVLRAKRVDHVYWFCHYLKPSSSSGGYPLTWNSEYQATGLRNDLSPPQVRYSEFQSRGAYPRPAWYAFRRLVWLLGQTSARFGISIPVNGNGLTAIRLRFRYPIRIGPDGRELQSSYKYAWVIWVDQFADSSCLHPAPDERTYAPVGAYLSDTAGTGYQYLSLVPEVTVDFAARTVDGNGYKDVSEVDWNWGSSNIIDPAWRAAVDTMYGETHTDEGTSFLYFTVRKCDPHVAIAPVCILTNASNIVFQ